MKILKDRKLTLSACALRSEDVKAVRQLTGLPNPDAVNILLQLDISGHDIQEAQRQLAPIPRKSAVKYLVSEAQ